MNADAPLDSPLNQLRRRANDELATICKHITRLGCIIREAEDIGGRIAESLINDIENAIAQELVDDGL